MSIPDRMETGSDTREENTDWKIAAKIDTVVRLIG